MDEISRQAAIDEAEEWIEIYYSGRGGQREQDAIKHVISGIKKLPSTQQWIPCSKRMPIAKHKTYWICTDTGYQCECRWTNVNHFWTDLTTEWHWHIMDIPQYSKVVAWRELPEPWKGDRNE